MTQAFNLAQLANNLNTSGQLDATDGLTGLVATANLATGTASSSNYLRGDQTWAALSNSNFTNRMINGGMQIDQRNAGASVTVGAAGGYYPVDRFYGQASAASKFTLQQSTDVPIGQGFVNSIVATSTSAYSITSGDYFIIRQAIEGVNCADMMFGSASAKVVTLSFWVKSSLTGTFGGHFTNNTSARWYPFTYTISSANTWEKKTVTLTGDTSGTWATNTSTGIYVGWSMGTGSSNETTANAWTSSTGISATSTVDLVATNAATFYMTGVQLEISSSATDFSPRPFGLELALCQRYFCKSFIYSTAPSNATNGTTLSTCAGMHWGALLRPNNGGVSGQDGTGVGGQCYGQEIKFPVTMRTVPTITSYGNSSGYWYYYDQSGNTGWATPLGGGGTNISTDRWNANFTSIINVWVTCNSFGHWTANAEL